MAYLEIGMWEILDVLRRLHRGESQAAIERVTGRTRKTVRRYASVARDLGWSPEGEEPAEGLARAVAERLRQATRQPAPGRVSVNCLRCASRSALGSTPKTSREGFGSAKSTSS